MHFEQFLRDFSDHILEKVEMSFTAKIVTFDSDKMTATIRPQMFFKDQTGQTINVPDIQKVPVEKIFGIKPHYKKNDLVSIRCYASSPEQPLNGLRTNQRLNRFMINYCSISGGLKRDPEDTNYLYFTDDAVNVNGKMVVTDDITINGISFMQFYNKFLVHTHAITTAPGTSGPPNP